MSYTKMNLEIEKWLKANDLPYNGTSSDSTEKTQERLNAYNRGRDVVYSKWMNEKKYKELISVAHQGWFSETDFFIPLADHFVKENEISPLKFLCERGIRFAIENTLSSLKNLRIEYPKTTVEEIISVDLDKYNSSNEFNSIANTAKLRKLALDRTDRYIQFLEQVSDAEYLKSIKNIQDKLVSLEIKKKDLSGIKNKLTK